MNFTLSGDLVTTGQYLGVVCQKGGGGGEKVKCPGMGSGIPFQFPLLCYAEAWGEES